MVQLCDAYISGWTSIKKKTNFSDLSQRNFEGEKRQARKELLKIVHEGEKRG